MALGLRRGGKALCVPPDAKTMVFADHEHVDKCGEVSFTDEGGGLWSVLFVESQVQFCIPDLDNPKMETRPKGAIGPWEKFQLSADKKSFGRRGVVVTIDGELSAPAKVPHLEVRGNDFVDKDGNRVVYPGLDGFDDLWFRCTGRESELDALMKESQQLAFVVRRIWCMGDAGENQVFSMYPQNIPGYFDKVRALVAYENSHGQIPLITAFVDAQRVMPQASDRRRFWTQLNEALQGSGAYLMSGGNQWTKNGFDPWADLSDPGHGVIWSRGSAGDVDNQVPPRGATFSELHATRISFERGLMDATASPPNMRSVSGSTLVAMTEGNPFGDGSAYTEHQARMLGCAYSIDWGMAVYHNRQSQRGQLMHDDTARSGAAFADGMTKGMFL